MNHFNKLTPAEGERLALLAEELAESIQAIGKILRHGYESRYPVDGPTNRESLERELGDVRCSLRMLCDAGDLNNGAIEIAAGRKSAAVKQYLHHQPA